jgi:hypothetical protein
MQHTAPNLADSRIPIPLLEQQLTRCLRCASKYRHMACNGELPAHKQQKYLKVSLKPEKIPNFFFYKSVSIIGR